MTQDPTFGYVYRPDWRCCQVQRCHLWSTSHFESLEQFCQWYWCSPTSKLSHHRTTFKSSENSRTQPSFSRVTRSSISCASRACSHYQHHYSSRPSRYHTQGTDPSSHTTCYACRSDRRPSCRGRDAQGKVSRNNSLTLDPNDSLILRKIESSERGRRMENNFLIDIRGEGRANGWEAR